MEDKEQALGPSKMNRCVMGAAKPSGRLYGLTLPPGFFVKTTTMTAESRASLHTRGNNEDRMLPPAYLGSCENGRPESTRTLRTPPCWAGPPAESFVGGKGESPEPARTERGQRPRFRTPVPTSRFLAPAKLFAASVRFYPDGRNGVALVVVLYLKAVGLGPGRYHSRHTQRRGTTSRSTSQNIKRQHTKERGTAE